jgi:ATP-dependent Clp protease protease subunit
MNDFRKFAKDKGVSMSVFDDIVKDVNNSLTPVVLEERKMNVVAMDVYSRMLYDRIIYFGHEFNQDTCNLLNAQLLYLSSLDERDINVYINSPGGSVVDGLSSIDVMNFIPNNVSTTCIGMAASMGAVLLSCGEKGKRFVLPHSRVMIHQVSSGMRGTYSDIKIEMEQTERCRNDVYRLLADNMGKTFEEVEMLCDRNNWFIGQEAVELGIVDKVLTKN